MKKILLFLGLLVLVVFLYHRYHTVEPVAYGHTAERYTFSDGYTTYVKQTCLYLDSSTQVFEYFQLDGPINEQSCVK